MSFFGFSNRRRPVNVRSTAYHPPFAPHSSQIEKTQDGDKVLLPGSVLELLNSQFGDDPLPYPVIFALSSDRAPTSKVTHVGVLEFSMSRGMTIVPPGVMENLGLQDGSPIRLKLTELPKAGKVILEPQSLAFAQIENPKAALQHAFRLFTCLTKGDMITLPIGRERFSLKVKEVYPDRVGTSTNPVRPVEAVCLIDSNLIVEIEAPEGKESDDVIAPGSGTGSKVQQPPGSNSNNGSATESKSPLVSPKSGFTVGEAPAKLLEMEEKVSGTLDADETIYYRVKLTDPTSGIEITVTADGGGGGEAGSEPDVDLFVATKTAKPSLVENEWQDVRRGNAHLVIYPSDPNYSTTWYYIGVHAYKKRASYTLVATRPTVDEAISKASLPTGHLLRTTSDERATLKDDPNMTYCSNCHDYIPKMSYSMHSLRCARSVFRCPVKECGKVLAAAEKDSHVHCPTCNVATTKADLPKHADVAHRKILCVCGSAFEPAQLAKHKATTCSMRSVACKYCELSLPVCDRQEHEDMCGAKTQPCDICGKYVVIKRMENHKAAEHGINPSAPDSGRVDWKGDLRSPPPSFGGGVGGAIGGPGSGQGFKAGRSDEQGGGVGVGGGSRSPSSRSPSSRSPVLRPAMMLNGDDDELLARAIAASLNLDDTSRTNGSGSGSGSGVGVGGSISHHAAVGTSTFTSPPRHDISERDQETNDWGADFAGEDTMSVGSWADEPAGDNGNVYSNDGTISNQQADPLSQHQQHAHNSFGGSRSRSRSRSPSRRSGLSGVDHGWEDYDPAAFEASSGNGGGGRGGGRGGGGRGGASNGRANAGGRHQVDDNSERIPCPYCSMHIAVEKLPTHLEMCFKPS